MKIPAQIQRLVFSVQRLVFVVILLTTYYLLLTTSAFAQAPNPYTAPNTNPDVPNNLHTWTQNVMIEVMAAATCQLAGVDPINPNQKCLGVDPQTNSIGLVDPSTGSGGAIGLMGNLIALTYTPPLHTGDYFSYLAQNFGLAKPAYAQGVGFQGLKPLMNLWIAFRNIVYLAFVVVFVVIGVAIMLRVKIDPRTVMTIENQIPKIIVGLLLVTFSFAIAGFLIDLMYISIYLLFNIFNNSQIISSTTITKINQTQGWFQGQNPFGVLNDLVGFRELVTDSAGGVKDIVQNLFAVGASVDPGKGPAQGITIPVISGIINIVTGILDFVRNALGALLGWVAGTLAFLVIAIAILWALFRLWFELIKAYIFILIDVVLAPFFVVLGLFPGSPIGFGAWMRDIIANLAVFPATIAMFLLGRVFMDAFGTSSATSPFVAPLIGNPGDPKAIGALIGLGIILMTPQILETLKAALKAPKLDVSAVGRAVGVGRGVITAPAQPVIQAAGFLGGQQFLKKLPGPIGGFFKP